MEASGKDKSFRSKCKNKYAKLKIAKNRKDMILMSNKLKYLMEKADFDPSKERKDMTIRKLCEDIEDGNIILPVF